MASLGYFTGTRRHTDKASEPIKSSSKPSGGGTSSTGGSQQTQGGATIVDDTEGLNIVNGSDLNKQMIEDAKDIDTGIDDPYAGYGEVTIGYGGDVSNSNSGGINKYRSEEHTSELQSQR